MPAVLCLRNYGGRYAEGTLFCGRGPDRPTARQLAWPPSPNSNRRFAVEIEAAGRILMDIQCKPCASCRDISMSWDKVHEGWKKVSCSTRETLGNFARRGFGLRHRNRVLSERKQTNESLRVEREKTDEAVAARQETVAKHADDVVDRARDHADTVLSVAREHADAVLDAARDKADKSLAPGARDGEPQTAIIEERNLADETLRDERENADETLRLEREEDARTVQRFLPLERESTDRYLRSERIRSDDDLANRDDFLAIVAHDLRDLIAGIALSARVLSKRAPENEHGKNTLEETARIERYAARMNRLIGDLVDVVSIDAGKLAVTPVVNDMVALIAEAEATFRASASAKGISIQTPQMDAAPLLAAFDHDRILQVLANLISNSLKFTAAGGKITVHGEREADNLVLSVADTGSGIPDDALESIFERFSQAGKDDRRGLGLGLYISRCIVEAHGGQIWAESKAGAGSRISFTLPIHPPAAAASDRPLSP